jgi:hypothetical protein
MPSDPNAPAAGQSSVSALNPYASPAEVGGYDAEAPAGIGVWRDGQLVVVHRKAAFPSVCIFTGRPAERCRRYGLVWSHGPFDWTTRRLYLHVPLSAAPYRAYRRRSLLGTLALLGPFVLLVLLLLVLSNDPFIQTLRRLSMVLLLAGFLVWAILRWWDGQPLRFVRFRKPYFWLAGANESFLVQLPPWTAGS